MSKGNTFENDFLKLIFNATPIANIADNAASAPLTNIEVGLNTADPGEAGTQLTNEAAYGAYARQPVLRTSGGWTVTANAVENLAAVTFPEASSGSETENFFHVGTANTGAGKILYSGAITVPLAVSVGITPEFGAGDIDITED